VGVGVGVHQPAFFLGRVDWFFLVPTSFFWNIHLGIPYGISLFWEWVIS
jgi:hypothetical protein